MVQGRVVAALLHAGEGAVLSHTTAGWWWGFIDHEPRVIHLSARVGRRRVRGVQIHRPRTVECEVHDRAPRHADVPRTLLDLASMLSFADLRRALAEADHRSSSTRARCVRCAGPGQRGSQALRVALDSHLPSLAHTLSALEERFLLLCEDAGVPLPEVNVLVAGLKVDALWRARRLVVELDGHDAHGYPAAAERDRRRELTLRDAGYDVRRYTWQQVTEQADRVIADLRTGLR